MKEDEASRNTQGALCYVLGWFSGVLFLIFSRDKFVRFHAAQSLVLFGILTVAYMMPIVGEMFGDLIKIGWLVAMLGLAYKAQMGETWGVPVIKELVERVEKKIN